MKPIRFNFRYDDDEPSYEGLTDGTHWNGFPNVWTTPETRDAIVAYFRSKGDPYISEIADLPVIDGLVSFAGGFATVAVESEVEA